MNDNALEQDWNELIVDSMSTHSGSARLRAVILMLTDLADAIDAKFEPHELYSLDEVPDVDGFQEPNPTGYGEWVECKPVDEGPDRRIDDED